MLVERLRIGRAACEERLRHAAVQPASFIRRHARGERLANPIVVQLDALRGSAAPHEMARAELSDERPFVAREAGGRMHDLRRHRPAADREQPQEFPCAVRQAFDPIAQHVPEGRCRAGSSGRRRA